MRYVVQWRGVKGCFLKRGWVEHPLTKRIVLRWYFVLTEPDDAKAFVSEEQAQKGFLESGQGDIRYCEVLPLIPEGKAVW